MTPETSSPPPSETPRRGCFGCLVTSGLGCGAFGLGALGAVALFAPSLLGGVLQRVLVSEWNDAIAGRVRLEALELSWTSPVVLRGLEVDDPEGDRVLALDLTLPPLLTLVDEDATAWEVTADLRTLEIELEEGGGTNLARALASDPASGKGEPFIRMGQFDSRDGLDQPFELTITLDGREALVHTGSALEPLLRLESIRGDVVHRAGRTKLDFKAQVVDGGGVVIGAAWGREWWDGESLLSVRVSGVPTAILDRTLETGGALEEGFGPQVTFVLDADQAADDRVTLELDGLSADGLGLDVDGRVAAGNLEIEGDGTLRGRGRLPAAWLAALVPAELPAGLRIEDEANPWNFEAPRLFFPLARRADGRRAAPRGQVVLTRDAALELVEHGAAGGRRVLHALAAPTLSLTWSDAGAARVDLSDRAGGTHVVELPAERGARGWSVAVPELATEVLARALGVTDLGELLGPRVHLRFEGTAGAGRLEVESVDGAVAARGRIDAGTLVAEAGDRVEVTLDLAEERHRGWLHELLPWYLELRKPADAPPAKLTLTEYRLPFSGDLADTRALGVLELDRVQCLPNPSFARRFASAESSEEIFGRMSFELAGEYIRYGDDLELAVGGEYYPFTGSHDLRGDQVMLSGEMPARYVTDAAPEVEDVIVKVTLLGPPDRLALNVDPAVLDAMKAGLATLLNLLGKDGE